MIVQGVLYRWNFRSALSDSDTRGSLPLCDRVLAARGLTDPLAAAAYLNPKLTQLHDPSLIPDLDSAAERILQALRRGEPLVIYGDYDVDGVTGTAILWHLLKTLAPDAPISTYVPHRLTEGYGLNAEAVESLAEAGARVIVSVDCGVSAIEPARVARRRGVDLIITDHHNPPAAVADLPDAFAVVHPRRPDSLYPFGDLSGAGVAYKLAWRIATLAAGSGRVAPPVREVLVDLLAFAALGAIADVVPLRGENRVIARFGLVRIKHSKFLGLRALVEASGLAGENVDSMDVGFRLGPRLNAAGRMGHAREANELFTTADPDRAAAIARELSRQNDDRRAVEREIFESADRLAETAGMTGPDRRAIVLAHPEWHAGVIGIVCSRLVERHCRPVILMNRRDGRCHGSGRSIEGFSLHAALQRCAPHLDKFGGHDMAAGLQLIEPKLAEFTDAFIADASGRIASDEMCRRLSIDCSARLEELTAQSVSELEAIEPCGAGNPNASLLIKGAIVADTPTVMGAYSKHLSLQIRADHQTTRVRAVGWNLGQYRDRLAPGMRIDLVVRPRVSTWGGGRRVEPEIRDFAVSAD